LFRHDSYFYYLTGFTEPNAWLVLTSDGQATLFCQPKDLEREIWDGVRVGPEAAPSQLGVHNAWSVLALDAKLPALLENKSVVWYPFATHKDLSARIETGLNAVRSRVRYGALCPEQQRDVCGILDEMRLVKNRNSQRCGDGGGNGIVLIEWGKFVTPGIETKIQGRDLGFLVANHKNGPVVAAPRLVGRDMKKLQTLRRAFFQKAADCFFLLRVLHIDADDL